RRRGDRRAAHPHRRGHRRGRGPGEHHRRPGSGILEERRTQLADTGRPRRFLRPRPPPARRGQPEAVHLQPDQPRGPEARRTDSQGPGDGHDLGDLRTGRSLGGPRPRSGHLGDRLPCRLGRGRPRREPGQDRSTGMNGTEISSAPDRIELRGLRVRGNHGVFDFEKREGQDFVIDVTLHTSVSRAAATDDLNETIHYGDLAEEVAGIVEDNTFDLIETLAERIADHCLRLCDHVEVVVHKPSAPIQRAFNDVRVGVERSRTATEAGPTATAEDYVNLVTNLGDTRDSPDQAVEAPDRHPAITVEARSSLYRTAPWGGVEQNDFLNLGLIVTTTLSATELLAVAQGIEVA